MSNDAIQRSNLASQIEQAARGAFDGGRLGTLLGGQWTAATVAIKTAFHDLGIKLGYRVAGSGCIGADPAWKYDLVWFVEDQDGFTTRLPLILESELKPRGKIDLDFVKLADGRADVRVWLSCSANPDDAKTHIENCVEQVRRFAGSLPGDTYVFIIFEWKTRNVMIETRVI